MGNTQIICLQLQVQEKAKCIIGKDYPPPMVDHKAASQRNCRNMEELQKLLMARCNMEPEHVKPSDASEVKKFFNLEPRENWKFLRASVFIFTFSNEDPCDTLL